MNERIFNKYAAKDNSHRLKQNDEQQYQQDTLAKRSPLEETLDITHNAIDELTNRIDLLANKLSPICLPMISPIKNDDSVASGSTIVNRMRTHLHLINQLNLNVNCILDSLEV